MLLKFKEMPVRQKWGNIILYLIGVVFMPFGVVLSINAHLGAGGYDALNFALGEALGINTSYAIYITAGLVLILTAFIRRGWPRLTTFISSFFLGIFTDIWKKILAPVEAKGLADGIVLLLFGVIIVGFAVACYVRSVFPTNPTDDFIVALNERGMNLGLAKILLDAACVVLAFLLGGEIGVGTVLCTFAIGPLVDLFHRLLRRILGPQTTEKAK